MALPTSGTISMGMINYEKANKVGTGTTTGTGNVTATTRDFVTIAADYSENAHDDGATSRADLLAAPYGMNEFYGYTYASCLLVGTEILMADGSIKFVEDLLIDDEVLTVVLPNMLKDKYHDYSIDNLDEIKKEKGLVKSLIFDFKNRYWLINDKYSATGLHPIFAWKDKIKRFEW